MFAIDNNEPRNSIIDIKVLRKVDGSTDIYTDENMQIEASNEQDVHL